MMASRVENKGHKVSFPQGKIPYMHVGVIGVSDKVQKIFIYCKMHNEGVTCLAD